MSIDRKQAVITKIKNNRKKIIVGSGLYVSILGLTYAANLKSVPSTGRRQFRVPFASSIVEEISNVHFQRNLRQFDGKLLDENNSRCKRVQEISMRIIEANEKEFPDIWDRKWTVTIVDDPLMNAMVFANGNIMVFRGMVDFCKTDGELAMIISHEISHVLLNHGAELYSHSCISDILEVPFLLPIWLFMPSIFGAVILHSLVTGLQYVAVQLPHDRQLESEADHVGLLMSSRACFDIRECVSFWQRLEMEQRKDLGLSPTDKIPKLISSFTTHPSHESRAKRLESLLEDAAVLRETCNCPPLPAKDPRVQVAVEKEELNRKYEKNKEKHVIRLNNLSKA